MKITVSNTWSTNMALFLTLQAGIAPRRGCAFILSSSFGRSTSASSETKLAAASTTKNNNNFFAGLQNAFSTMTEAPKKSKSPFFTVAVCGSTGLVGNALMDELNKRDNMVGGKPVKLIQLIRDETSLKPSPSDNTETRTTALWNPKAPTAKDAIDLEALKDVDAVINLSGENIANGLGPLGFLGLRPWSDEKKKSVLESRVPGAQILSEAVKEIAESEKKQISYLCASGVGVYGYDFVEGEKDVDADESFDTSNTKGFLGDVSREWEAAAVAAGPSKNVRTVCMRFGVVMSKNGGALGKLYPIYFLGGGGPVGSGKQYFSYISARDIARAILHTLETPSLKGPVNLVSPNPCTYGDFNAAMGKSLKRPVILPLPAFAVNLLFGEMGEEMLLGGVKAIPSKLLQSGFSFEHDTIEKAVDSAVNETI
jgi:uncharacterized protein (TIGR01777 family)